MAASRLTDEEIAVLLSEVSNGASMEAVCEAAHVSVRTFYRWKRKFDGLTPSGVRQLKALRRENSELRRLLAERSARPPLNASPAADASERRAQEARLREMHGVNLGRFATVRVHGG
ncbi:transposase [Methylopila henanensis]|uniref:Transposase n=1 Tax=Methylopila henanensis TaxID=873516 RepID=A0ABW4K6Q5_9HYPH